MRVIEMPSYLEPETPTKTINVLNERHRRNEGILYAISLALLLGMMEHIGITRCTKCKQKVA
jgi:hypothetical protein